MAASSQIHIVTLATLLMSSCGVVGTSQQQDNQEVSPLDTWTTEDAPATHATQPHEDESTDAPDQEICDGRDNDDDGQVDENTAAGSCEGNQGESGVMSCIEGRLRCVVCNPGETRQSECSCSERVDVCGNDYQWVLGPCDDCNSPFDVPCEFCGYVGSDGQCINPGECEPGQTRYERCDSCPPGIDCSADNCIGRGLRCGNDCQWQVIEECAVRQRECSRDETRREDCGQCGEVQIECDGCFWNNADACDEQGDCVKGVSARVPCGSGCNGYRAATTKCNSECKWETGGCGGCSPGYHTRNVGCQCGGARTQEYWCEVTEVGCGIGFGEEYGHNFLDECPPFDCTPGATDSSGGQCRHCRDDCTWSDWGGCGGDEEPPPPGDTPCSCSGTRTVSCNDACGNTRTDTCVNCSWVTGSCPPCSS